MRLSSFLLLFFLAPGLRAHTARVLIDEKAQSQKWQGAFTLECYSELSSLKPYRQYQFSNGDWTVQSHVGGAIDIRSSNGVKVQRCLGQKFQMMGLLFWQGQKILGMTHVAHQGKKDWVIHVPIDQYLVGVLSAEVPSSWPLAALKAQAIASRTYFLYKKQERQKDHYDVRADTMDQVFRFLASEKPNLNKAVYDTVDWILVDSSSQIFPAFFHADCGGQTSTERNVWRFPTSENSPVRDPLCQKADRNNWVYSIRKLELIQNLQALMYLPPDIELQSIYPRVQQEGRAYVVDFLFSERVFKRMSANDLRKALGFAKLKSTHFSVHDQGQDLVFRGRGFGHGVGLCQWGAQRWAQQGKSHEFILRHYYPNARLIRQNTIPNIHKQQAQLEI